MEKLYSNHMLPKPVASVNYKWTNQDIININLP